MMILKIETIDAKPHDSGEQRNEWHISGTLYGGEVSMVYLDAGNNAEYEPKLAAYIHPITPHDDSKRYIEAFKHIEEWLPENEDVLGKLRPSDTINFAVKEQENQEDLKKRSNQAALQRRRAVRNYLKNKF